MSYVGSCIFHLNQTGQLRTHKHTCPQVTQTYIPTRHTKHTADNKLTITLA